MSMARQFRTLPWMAVLLVAAAPAAWAINAPTITHVSNIAVLPATTMFASSTAVLLRGNAESGATVNIYRASTVLIGTAVADGTGKWTCTVTLSETTHQVDADATITPFVSTRCTVVPIKVDLNPPNVSLCPSWGGRNYLSSGYINSSYCYASVSEYNGTNGSGLDLTSIGFKIQDITGAPTNIPVTWTNNGADRADFVPSSGYPAIQGNGKRYQIDFWIKDKAGNIASRTYQYWYDGTGPAAAQILKVYDPCHRSFVGTGEPSSNLPDAGGWVNYYQYMHVGSQPITVRCSLATWTPVWNTGFEAAGMSGYQFNHNFNFTTATSTQFQVTGNQTFYNGSMYGYIYTYDAAYNYSYTYLYFTVRDGNPPPPPPPPTPTIASPPYVTYRPLLTGSDRTVPTFHVTAGVHPVDQIIWLYGYGYGTPGNFNSLYSFCQVVKPSGQTYTGTPGLYDDGDVWWDANRNHKYDAGEEVYDLPTRVSDGKTATFPNFKNVEFHANGYSYAYVQSWDTVIATQSSGSNWSGYWYSDELYTEYPTAVDLTPEMPFPYRRTATKPTQAVMTINKTQGYTSPESVFGINKPLCNIRLLNNINQVAAGPYSNWVYSGSGLRYTSTWGLATATLTDGTWRFATRIVDYVANSSDTAAFWFKMDNVAPMAQDIVPPDGALSNTFTSFNARIVDPVLLDGSSGSGANIDVNQPQIWPYRLLTLPSTPSANQSTIIFNLRDGEMFPTNHVMQVVATGTTVEAWQMVLGAFTTNTFDAQVTAVYGDGRVGVTGLAGVKFAKDKTWAILLPVPFFTSNNGIDRVGAVPTQAIIQDGTYVTRVVTLDMAGNAGAFFTTTSPLEVPIGLITFNSSQTELFAGLVPPDVATFTSNSIRTRKNNPVLDGQPVSLVQLPNTLTQIVPPDANGIPGDGHQVLFGQNGAPSGTGQFSFGVRATSTLTGNVSIYGVIGLASGTSAPLPVVQIDPFTVSASPATVLITPLDPNPRSLVSTGYLGRPTRAVPDGSLATCTCSFGTITPDADVTLVGTQAAVLNASASYYLTSPTKGTGWAMFRIGNVQNNTWVTFVDKYPPPAPATITVNPEATNTGAAVVSWASSTDLGGAGMWDYQLDQSFEGGPWVGLATTTALTRSISGLADGTYRFRVNGRDLDGNIGSSSLESPPLVIDRVNPPAVSCSDNGPDNNDPDDVYSADGNVYFYFTPTDDRSGPATVSIQIATVPDFSVIAAQVSVPTTTSYCFTGGLDGNTYYARVAIHDRAGNVGAYGAPSDGITVIMPLVSAPPSAPTITQIAGKGVLPGVPTATNQTANIPVAGMAEARCLLELWVDGGYLGTYVASSTGAYLGYCSLAAGTHTVKTRARNSLGVSAFSTSCTVVVDLTPPGLELQLEITGGYIHACNYVASRRGAHNITNLNLIVTDTGGAGFDIAQASIEVTDIDDAGVPVPPPATLTNPLTGVVSIITADQCRFIPSPAWKDCLQDGHRYRITCSAVDKAGNPKVTTRDVVIDNVLPGEAAGVPVTDPPNCNIRSMHVYDLEKFPSTTPPLASMVPLLWDGARFSVDPGFSNPLLVDSTAVPPALLFNTVGFYATFHEAEAYNLAPMVGHDSLQYSFGVAWGYGASINLGVDGLGNSKWCRFPYTTLVNGISTCTLYLQDTAICRNYYEVRLNIQSPTPAPSPPTKVEFYDATNPVASYPVFQWNTLFALPGGVLTNRDVMITNTGNPMLLKVQVPIEMFDQRVEAFNGGTVYASVTVPAGGDFAALVMNPAGPVSTREFQVRTVANGYKSANLPRLLNYYYFRWICGDTASPTTFSLYPTEENYNALAGADARPFPTRFSVQAKDTADGAMQSWLEIAPSSAALVNAGESPVSGVLTREYNIVAGTYGFRYDLPGAPTAEGTYRYRTTLVDAARFSPQSLLASFPFRLDKTPPFPVNISPASGAVTNSLPSFNCQASDPPLADGTAGSGPNVDPSRAQIVPYKLLGSATATVSNTLTVTVYGIDVAATDHVDRVLPVGEAIFLAKVNANGTFDPAVVPGTITANGGDQLKVSTAGLAVGQRYAVIWPIPCFQSNDGVDRLAAVPVQQAVKGGAYLAYINLLDRSLNPGSYVSVSSIYEAAYGPITLAPSRTSLYVGLQPPHAATYTSSAIMTTEGNPILAGTQVTVFTQPAMGTFGPADANGIPGDGHQVAADASGKLRFNLLASGSATGLVTVRAILGLASGTDSSVTFVQLPPFNVTVGSAALTITSANLYPETLITAGTFGNVGDLVPNGTFLNASASIGGFTPADGDAVLSGHQVVISGGGASFKYRADSEGLATLVFECGGRTVTRTLPVIDQAPPTTPGVPDVSPALSGTGNFLVTWGAATDPGNSGVAGYDLEYSFNGGAWTPCASVALPLFTTSNLAHGLYRFRARARDRAGNIGAYSGASSEVEADRVPPIGTVAINGGAARTATTAVNLELSASDPHGVAQMRFSNDGAAWSTWRTYGATSSWTLSSGDGGKVVSVQYMDGCGNISPAIQAGIILDTTGPTGGVTLAPAPVTATTTLALTFNANDSAGVPTMAIAYDGGAVATVTYVPGLVWTVPAVDATHSVWLRYLDALGNPSEIFCATTCVDVTKPTKPVATDDGVFSPFIDRLHVSWTSSTDATSGVDRYVVRVGTATGTDNVASDTNAGLADEWTFNGLTLDLSGATQYYFTVVAIDRAGNVSLPGYTDGVKGGDPTPPDPVTVYDAGAYTATSTQLHASWTASVDPDSGINRYQFSVGTTPGGTEVVGWTDCGISYAYTATGLSLVSGTTYWANVRIWNNGGTSTICVSDGIIVDTVAPPPPVMTAEPTYSSGTVNVVAGSTVVDALSGGVAYQFVRADDAALTVNAVTSGWLATPTTSFAGLTHGQLYHYALRARDAVGNTSAWSAPVSSRQDANPPTAVGYTDAIAANNHPDADWTDNGVAGFVASGLSDDLSGVKNIYVQVATSSGFAAPVWEGWLNNTSGDFTFDSSSKPAIVDGDTLFARARYEDVAGNLSGWQTSDGIRIDRQAPVAGATSDHVGNTDPSEKISGNGVIHFTFAHSDATSGVVDVYLQIASDSGFAQIASAGWLGGAFTACDYLAAAEGATYTARIKVRDRAGHESGFGAPSDGIFVWLSPPPVAAFTINDGEPTKTTATTTVKLSFTAADPTGIASVTVSNDALLWWPFAWPPGATMSWDLPAGAGVHTIWVKYTNHAGHTTPAPYLSQSIGCWPTRIDAVVPAASGTYPVDTYDEYAGQNKYGRSRAVASGTAEGRSLQLRR